MKARFNITGEIVDIEDMSVVTYKSSDGTWVKTLIKNFTFLDAEKDYYIKLEHQYAGMAMQGLLAHEGTEFRNYLLQEAKDIAHNLVEKYKKEERK